MDKDKLIPILLIIVLIGCAIGIFSWNSNKNKSKFSKLVVTYQGQETTYDDIKIDTHFSFENVNFYFSGIQKDLLVLTTDRYVTVNLKQTSEFQIDVNEFASVCFSENNCAEFRLA